MAKKTAQELRQAALDIQREHTEPGPNMEPPIHGIEERCLACEQARKTLARLEAHSTTATGRLGTRLIRGDGSTEDNLAGAGLADGEVYEGAGVDELGRPIE